MITEHLYNYELIGIFNKCKLIKEPAIHMLAELKIVSTKDIL